MLNNNITVEHTVLGNIINNDYLLDDYSINRNMFMDIINKTLFDSILEYKKDNGNLKSSLGLIGYLSQEVYTKDDWIDYINQLTAYDYIHLFEEDYKILKQQYEATQFINELKKTNKEIEEATSYTEIEELKNKHIKSLQDINIINNTIKPNDIKNIFNKKNSDLNYIKTKQKLNTYLNGGLKKSELVVLAGATGMGKTTVAIDLLVDFMKTGYRCVYYSLEMDEEEIYIKIANNYLDKFGRDVDNFTNKEIEKIEELGKNTVIIDKGDINLERIENDIKQFRRENRPLDIVFIDYLQIMKYSNKRQSEYEFLSEATKQLKQIARNENIVIILLSQLNRNNNGRDNKRPMLSDLRGSGSIEQDANIIIIIHREEYYYLTKEDKETPEDIKNILELRIAKFRRGAPTNVLFKSILGKSQIRELDKENISSYLSYINKTK